MTAASVGRRIHALARTDPTAAYAAWQAAAAAGLRVPPAATEALMPRPPWGLLVRHTVSIYACSERSVASLMPPGPGRFGENSPVPREAFADRNPNTPSFGFF